jgi:chaperonin GroES
MIHVQPLHDYLVLRQEEAVKQSPGGILIPDGAQRPPSRGTVLAAGPGKLRDTGDGRHPMDVKVDDVVLYTAYAGHPVELDGDKYLMLRAEDVIGKVVK